MWREVLKGLAQAANQVTEFAIPRAVLNHRLEGIGHVRRLDIDKKNKIISVEVLLNGETEPLDVTVVGYALVQKDALWLRVDRIRANRPWVTNLADRFLKEHDHMVRLPGRIPRELLEYLV